MHGSNTCFVWKMNLRMFIIKIESYRDIILYFCEICLIFFVNIFRIVVCCKVATVKTEKTLKEEKQFCE